MSILMFLFFISSIVLTIILKFPQLKIFRVIKKCKNKNVKQMFYLSLATNLGVGNLIGVSSALYYGGPGVIFWMAIFAFFSSSFAYLETKYSILSKVIINNEQRTGTCYTIRKFINNKVGISISIIFAVMLLLTNSIFFPPIQVNAIINMFDHQYQLIFGIILFLLIAIITIKGIKMILKITDILIPYASVAYTILIIYLILCNYHTLLPTLKLIINSAFNVKSIGISGVLLCIQTAINKSLFSNEAGLGTMPSLLGEASVKYVEEVSNYQMLSVIVDTVVLCTLTGIFILQNHTLDGNVTLIFVESMTNSIGNIGLVISNIFIFIFGFSSIIGQFYLGESNALFFKKYYNINLKFIFNILFYIGIVIGIFLTFESVNKILDVGMVLLGLINILVIFVIRNKEKNNKKT